MSYIEEENDKLRTRIERHMATLRKALNAAASFSFCIGFLAMAGLIRLKGFRANLRKRHVNPENIAPAAWISNPEHRENKAGNEEKREEDAKE
ncbi:hypothetical protein DFJ77DRAFT_512905 [Powellomyces hirtus]|nr:hypothetical protein DFJ77DRAFT_512905 [Powellomyces hirtus]